jgi:hypothetical protein
MRERRSGCGHPRLVGRARACACACARACAPKAGTHAHTHAHAHARTHMRACEHTWVCRRHAARCPLSRQTHAGCAASGPMCVRACVCGLTGLCNCGVHVPAVATHKAGCSCCAACMSVGDGHPLACVLRQCVVELSGVVVPSLLAAPRALMRARRRVHSVRGAGVWRWACPCSPIIALRLNPIKRQRHAVWQHVYMLVEPWDLQQHLHAISCTTCSA